eukprot:4751307-Amphidinium_carterae.2
MRPKSARIVGSPPVKRTCAYAHAAQVQQQRPIARRKLCATLYATTYFSQWQGFVPTQNLTTNQLDVALRMHCCNAFPSHQRTWSTKRAASFRIEVVGHSMSYVSGEAMKNVVRPFNLCSHHVQGKRAASEQD